MTRRLATLTLASCTLAVLVMPPGPTWPAVVVAGAVLLGGWVWLRLDERDDGVTADDVFVRIDHPTAWKRDWPMESDGIERPER